MANYANKFRNFTSNCIQGKVNIASSGTKLNCILVTSAPTTANLDAWQHYSDVVSGAIEVATGGGYNQGGIECTVVGVGYLAANSWPHNWASGVAVNVNDIYIPKVGGTTGINGHVYRALTAATTTTEPTWTTGAGDRFTTDAVVWEECGLGVTYITLTVNPSWTGTITARGAIFMDVTTGVAATEPLVCYMDFGASISSTSAAFTVQLDANNNAILLDPVY